jgi:hypothetical protein
MTAQALGQKTFADTAWSILRPLGWLCIAGILIAPAVAMRFTDEVQWTQSDFVVAGIVLIGAGAVVEMFALMFRNPVARIAFGLFMVILVGLAWGMMIN